MTFAPTKRRLVSLCRTKKSGIGLKRKYAARMRRPHMNERSTNCVLVLSTYLPQEVHAEAYPDSSKQCSAWDADIHGRYQEGPTRLLFGCQRSYRKWTKLDTTSTLVAEPFSLTRPEEQGYIALGGGATPPKAYGSGTHGCRRDRVPPFDEGPGAAGSTMHNSKNGLSGQRWFVCRRGRQPSPEWRTTRSSVLRESATRLRQPNHRQERMCCPLPWRPS